MYEIPAGEGYKELHIQLLGGFAVSVGGERIPDEHWKSRRGRNLVKLLALTIGHRLHRDQVCETFWPDSDPSAAANNFHRTLYVARQVLESHGAGRLVLEEGFLTLDAGSCQVLEVDVEQFEAVAALARGSQDPRAYQEAVACYTGDLLPDDLYEEWTLKPREALRQACLQLLLELARLHEARQEYPLGIAALQQAVFIEKCHEEAHAGLMRLYAHSGQTQQAIRQYQLLCDALDEELAVKPSHVTTQLYEAIQSGRTSPASPWLQPAHNLPVQLTPIQGREKEIETLRQVLLSGETRLVTLFGPGGIGKTRLALEIGWMMLPAFADGVFLAELDTRQQGESLISTISQAVGMPQASGPMTGRFGSDAITVQEMQRMLANYLAEKHLLLILDGCEQQLKEIALVVHLLRYAPRLAILATSRARLSLEAEQIFPVEGLSYPSDSSLRDVESYGAVQLFVEAGRRADPGFQLTAVNRQDVAEICRLVQGIPLGIVLAAGWCGMLEPEQIAREIRANLDFLALAGQDLPDRQRSLRATFDYSVRLLGENERKEFLSLSVFHGPFSAARARQVCGATLHTLRFFLNQSLLIQASAGRYVMHDLLRQYAQEKLAANPAESLEAHERHCQVFLEALQAWHGRLKTSAQIQTLAEMDQEYGDIVAAWEWALAHGKIAQLLRTRDALFYYHFLRNRFAELADLTRRWLADVERADQSMEQQRLWVLMGAWQARALTYQYHYDRAFLVSRQIEDQLARLRFPIAELSQELVRFHQVKGVLVEESGGSYLLALQDFQLSLERAYASEDPWEIANALVLLASGHGWAGNIQEMGQFTQQALNCLNAQGDPDPFIKSSALVQLGYFYYHTGQSEAGLQVSQEQSALRARFDDPFNQAFKHGALAWGLYHAGQFEQARPHFIQAVNFIGKAGRQKAVPLLMDMILLIKVLTGDYDSVLETTTGDGAVSGSVGSPLRRIVNGMAYLVRGRYDLAEVELQLYIDHMESLLNPDMIWAGVGRAILASSDYCKGNLVGAKQNLQQALESAVAQGHYVAYTNSLALLARMLAEAGEVEQAVEVYAAASSHPVIGNSKYFDDMFGRHVADRARQLPAEVVEAARARGRSMTLSQAGEKFLARLKDPADLLANLQV